MCTRIQNDGTYYKKTLFWMIYDHERTDGERKKKERERGQTRPDC